MRVGAAISGAVWIGVLGLVGYVLWVFQEGRQEEQRLREALARLSAEQRVARILVRGITPDPATGHEITHLDWVEELPGGGTSPRRSFALRGNEVRFEALQIVFDGDLVRDGDPLKGNALHLFRRAYGQHQTPLEGVRLDAPDDLAKSASGDADTDVVPAFYRVADQDGAALERRLWTEFWELARDQERARAEGIRSAQGVSVFKPLVAGMEYRLTLTATGQLILDGPSKPSPFVDLPPER